MNKQADGEKTCGTCRNEDTYHCAECENKSDYEQSQAEVNAYAIQSALDNGTNTVIGTAQADNIPVMYYPQVDGITPTVVAQADGEYISKDKMLMFLNDMRYGIAPDETVADGDERREREAQVDVLDDLMEVVEQMPSVAIPNKVGHWEYNQYDGNPNIGNWHCSECRNIVSDMPTCMGKPLYEFCPNCGCPMEIER